MGTDISPDVASGDSRRDVGLGAHVDELLAANAFLTLSTVEAGGTPWTTPVYFAPAPGHRFVWISETDARHTGNLLARPAVSLVVFDSSAAPYHGRAVYAVGTARELGEDEVDDALEHFPGPPGRGVDPMGRAEVTGPSPYRLYAATATQLWVLCPREPRLPCARHGLARDHRARVL